jgi:calcineurin-like phosphoesterase family protein
LKFCPETRPYASIEEHDATQIANFQKLVKPEDTVWFLGDVFFCNENRSAEILSQIPGRKNLVYGNHDQTIKNSARIRGMFESVQDYKELRSVTGVNVVLFHFPMMEWNRMHHGAYALFGHVHGSMDNDPLVLSGRTMDVGVDSRPAGVTNENGFLAPWGWNRVHQILGARPRRTHHNKVVD